jgi:hypothetical protein
MRLQRTKGSILIQVIAFMAIGIVILSGFVGWGTMSVRTARHTEYRDQAIQIAEAGIDYYRWHLAHAPSDFQDGTATSGPYVHNYYDKQGNSLGTFTLTITPPPVGSTLVTIKSAGKVTSDPSIVRTVQTRLAKPSLAKYAVVANSFMNFGPGTEIFGPIHSNGGIRFDGLAHNIVTSALSSFDDPTHSGGSEFGVHTHVTPTDPLPPTAVPSRVDVFQVGRTFPVPAVDFAGLTANLAQIKTDAQANGVYYAASGAQGYHITLKTTGKFDIKKVNSLFPAPGGCTNAQGEANWGTWSINTTGGAETVVATNVDFPANGLIFVEDNLWIDGQINNARLTIAAATFPDAAATRKNIIVNNNLLYTNYDGTDVLSLMAQNDIIAGLKSADTQEIDGALIAQNGRTGRNYYAAACGAEYRRSSMTLYGMIGTYQQYGFAWSGTTYNCPDGTQRSSGYCTRTITYDANMLYGPPPSFPLTTSQYQVVSWDEI